MWYVRELDLFRFFFKFIVLFYEYEKGINFIVMIGFILKYWFFLYRCGVLGFVDFLFFWEGICLF